MEVEMNQDTVANRLKVFVSSLGAMKKDVLEQAGIHTTQFSRVLNGHQQPGFTFLLKFTTAFPELNLNWLLTGQGESETQTLSVGEKKIIQDYRELQDSNKIRFEVQSGLFGLEVDERSKLDQTIDKNARLEAVMTNKETLTTHLLFLQDERRKNHILLKEGKKNIVFAMLGREKIDNDIQDNEAEIEKLITLDIEIVQILLKL
jgi:hypothetical protein